MSKKHAILGLPNLKDLLDNCAFFCLLMLTPFCQEAHLNSETAWACYSRSSGARRVMAPSVTAALLLAQISAFATIKVTYSCMEYNPGRCHTPPRDVANLLISVPSYSWLATSEHWGHFQDANRDRWCYVHVCSELAKLRKPAYCLFCNCILESRS